MKEHYLTATLVDWTAITSAKRLRGALSCAASLMRKHGDIETADKWDARVKRMRQDKRRMPKETINCFLFSACCEVGLIA